MCVTAAYGKGCASYRDMSNRLSTWPWFSALSQSIASLRVPLGMGIEALSLDDTQSGKGSSGDRGTATSKLFGKSDESQRQCFFTNVFYVQHKLGTASGL